MMQIRHVTSPTNVHFRTALRLRDGRARRKSGLFLVDGVREIQRALAANISLAELFISDQLAAVPFLQSLLPSAATVITVPPEMLRELQYGERDEGAVAVFATPDRSLQQLSLPECPLVVVLDQMEKPGNIGAIFRSADAAGADAVILSEPLGDMFNPNAIRASAGTLFHLPSASASRIEVQQWLKDHHIRPVVTHLRATKSHWDCDWKGGVAMVLGNEAVGLGEEWGRHESHIPNNLPANDVLEAIKIPMSGIADSLNASVTAAICLFEAVRQRQK